MFAKLRLLVGWALVALLAIFVFLNRSSTTVHFLIGEVYMPKAFVVIFSALLGAGVVLAFQWWKTGKRPPK